MDDRHAIATVVDAEVSCVVEGVDHRLPLYDLSASGCMIDSPKALIPLGRRLVVNLFRNIAVPARVIWQRGGRIGLRFLSPLHNDLVQQLALAIRQRAAERYAFRDPFGRPVGALPVYPNVLASVQACSHADLSRGISCP